MSRRSVVPWALPTLITALGALLVWLGTRTSFFFADDWLNFGQARDFGMGWDLLTEPYAGHLAPGHRVLDWILVNPFPADWGAYLAIMLAFYVVALLAFWVLLAELEVPRPAAVAALVLFAVAAPWVRSIQWDAAAGHTIPATAATVVSLALAAAWMRRRRLVYALLSPLAMAFGMAFYEKPVLVIGYVILLRWITLPSLHPRALIGGLRTDAPLLGGLLVVSVIYTVLVVAGGYSSTGPSVSASTWLDYLRRSWTDGSVTMLVGQGRPEYAPAIPLALRILAQLLLAALVFWSVRRAHVAWRAWAFLAIVFLTNIILLGIGRVGGFGPRIGLDPRYYAEMAFLLPLAIALAFRPAARTSAAAAVAATARRAGGDLRPRSAVAWAGVAIAGALLVVSTLNNNHRLDRSWEGRQARAWADKVRAQSEPLRDASGRLSLLEDGTPTFVRGINLPPYDQLSLIGDLLVDDPVVFDGSGERPLVVEDDGSVRPAVISPLAGGSSADPGARATVVAGAGRPTARGFCATSDAQVRLTARIEVPVQSQVRVEVDRVGGDAARGIEVRVDRGDGIPEGYEKALLVWPGSTKGAVGIAPGPIRAFSVTVPAGTCMTRAEVAQLT
jgi:hypothetical protein